MYVSAFIRLTHILDRILQIEGDTLEKMLNFIL
jgi:hypothetical protein